jgi:hypothetical protein
MTYQGVAVCRSNFMDKEAVTGAIEAGDEIGAHASKAVRDALTTSIKGAKDVIKPPPKYSESTS